MDWPHIFPGSLVPLASGLYVVHRDIFTICWGPGEYLLAWGEFWESTNSMDLIKLGTLCLLVREVVSDSLYIDWMAGSTRVLEHPIV